MKFVTLIAAAVGCLLLLSMTGCATTEDGKLYSYGEQGEVIVGSRIRRTAEQAEDGATPVRVFNRDEMKRTGARSVGGFVGGGEF
ncbi:MAG: hypothetical protein MJA32_12615 [Proteobacteria bacterium]|nr:hypothetical protein [Pseudomonadota bacterium]